jgi:acetyl esterase/lipase
MCGQLFLTHVTIGGQYSLKEMLMRIVRRLAVATFSLALLAPGITRAQSDAMATMVRISNAYQLTPNITYRTASNWDAKLDLYQPRGLNAPNPVLMFFHGGGWTAGAKEGVALNFLPYLEAGWTVLNVEYRLTNVALAPAAVEDARCALRWVYRNAKQYNFDTEKIVTTGESAGGHLAMTTAMLPESAGFDNTCPGNRAGGASSGGATNTDGLKVAAVVDWYGISDVHELLSGPNMKSYAVAWLGALPYRAELAKQLSPETYVNRTTPPIISVHGDADPTVPYSQKQRLHQALDKAGAIHELVTIPNGKHGGFTDGEKTMAFSRIRSFLAKQNVQPSASQVKPQTASR